MAWVPVSAMKKAFPTRGGMGSFSYADTKVYVPGAPPAYWMQQLWKVGPNTGEMVDDGKRLWVPPGTIVGPQAVIPGQGGGAKLPGKRLYGGASINRAAYTELDPGSGPSPNGFVLIRVMKID